jgi:hypothetical protein
VPRSFVLCGANRVCHPRFAFTCPLVEGPIQNQIYSKKDCDEKKEQINCLIETRLLVVPEPSSTSKQGCLFFVAPIKNYKIRKRHHSEAEQAQILRMGGKYTKDAKG